MKKRNVVVSLIGAVVVAALAIISIVAANPSLDLDEGNPVGKGMMGGSHHRP